MARIVLGTWAFRYPLGGNLSWTLQWAVGLQRLGHDVFIAEKSGYRNACYDPVSRTSSDDAGYALKCVPPLLARHDLDRRWCFVDEGGTYFGLNRDAVETVFRSADVFVDLGTHGTWLPEAEAGSCATVLVDGEPGYTQMRREIKKLRGGPVPDYHHYYSNGANLPTATYTGPTAGKTWRAVYNPVVADLFPHLPPAAGAPFTTVMNWQAHAALEYGGATWRQKDVEFAKFLDLPQRTGAPLEIAVSDNAPLEALRAAGWRTRSGRGTTLSYDAFVDYVVRSAGEFSACKQAYVALRTGWFSDRSAAYLAGGRPVIMQDTGFSAHLPSGEGLFAVNTVAEAAAAMEAVLTDPARHSAAARDLARAHLDTAVILPRFLRELGV